MSFATGLDVLLRTGGGRWRGARAGLLYHQAAVDRSLELSPTALHRAAPGMLRALFTPQHGAFGEEQDNMKETPHSFDPELGVPCHSLYSETRRPTPEMLDGLDVLFVDLQDVGCRVYTYVWTLLHCLEECARHGLEVVVLDRPNPIGGQLVEGPLLRDRYRSFVGGAACPMRHGLTLGEAARWLRAERDLDVALEVVPLEGWSRERHFADLGRVWVPPSPNLPRLEGVDLYCGQVLWEGTGVSEGRGTTTPFELCGAPYADGARWWAEARETADLPGVLARPVRFRPMFGKGAGRSCGGLRLHVTDRRSFRPYRTTLALLVAAKRLWPREFTLAEPPYEYETEKSPLDLLHGSEALRLSLEDAAHADPTALAAVDEAAWWNEVEPFLLYR